MSLRSYRRAIILFVNFVTNWMDRFTRKITSKPTHPSFRFVGFLLVFLVVAPWRTGFAEFLSFGLGNAFGVLFNGWWPIKSLYLTLVNQIVGGYFWCIKLMQLSRGWLVPKNFYSGLIKVRKLIPCKTHAIVSESLINPQKNRPTISRRPAKNNFFKK